MRQHAQQCTRTRSCIGYGWNHLLLLAALSMQMQGHSRREAHRLGFLCSPLLLRVCTLWRPIPHDCVGPILLSQSHTCVSPAVLG